MAPTAVTQVNDGPTDLDAHVETKQVAGLDASKITVELTNKPTELAADLHFTWGANFTDHMLVVTYDPTTGWSAPAIKPYGPLSLDPASAVLHYGTGLFEGMKAYKPTADSPPLLFRPDMNMARMKRSAARIELPDFDGEEFLKCIEKLISVDAKFIPPPPYSLYLRPTMIGTRPQLGVAASQICTLYVIMCPVGPFFPTVKSADKSQGVFTPIPLLATEDAVRAWPGGAGEHKLASNYGICFNAQRKALELGYKQNLWVLDGKITECGQMNFFMVFKNDNDAIEVVTPPLNGIILPGVTRDSILTLLREYVADAQSSLLSKNMAKKTVVVSEREVTLDELVERYGKGEVLEAFGSGTAAVILPISKVGLQRTGEDLVFPEYEGGLGPVARGVYETIASIQEGRVEHPWRVVVNV